MKPDKIIVTAGYVNGKLHEWSGIMDNDITKTIKEVKSKIKWDKEPAVFLVDFENREVIWK